MRMAIAALLVLAVAATACVDTKPSAYDAAQARRSLAGTWILQSVEVDSVERALPDPVPFFAMSRDVVTFNLGCADVHGDVLATGAGSLKFPELLESRNDCFGESTGLDSPFVRVLLQTTEWSRNGDQLMFSGGTARIRWLRVQQ